VLLKKVLSGSGQERTVSVFPVRDKTVPRFFSRREAFSSEKMTEM
jgi:hypothetical protein